ncbi:MAG: hypothetical protein PVJ80_17365 [Gemmatimonadota bacterium]|jgi:hypothetical protein
MDTAVSTTPRSDTLWGAAVSGAYASAATALLFLVIDSVRGEPLQTASTLGSVVLLGQEPSSPGPFRVDMVALYSLIHLGAFVLIGAAATRAYQTWDRLRTPVALALLLTIALTGGVALVDALFFPGIIWAIGPWAMLGGNVAAAVTMTWVLDSGLALGSSRSER